MPGRKNRDRIPSLNLPDLKLYHWGLGTEGQAQIPLPGQDPLEVVLKPRSVKVLIIMNEALNGKTKHVASVRGWMTNAALAKAYSERENFATSIAVQTMAAYLSEINRAIKEAMLDRVADCEPPPIFMKRATWGVRLIRKFIIIDMSKPKS